jgi:hypothetical protein
VAPEWVRDTSGTALKTTDAMLDKISELLTERRIMGTAIATVVCCGVCDKPTIRIPDEFDYLDAEGIITARCGAHA